ncbi:MULTISPECIES: hypothetical protein [unclassified Kribbella]|uniref:hypothetical protein n=1 Tax=unclassified Kribbella TaxID=2644121 RepID=UPI0033E7631A
MGRYWPLIGAGIGALVLVVANVAFAWFATAPSHYEWTDPAVFMSPFAAIIGAYLGAIIAHLARRRSNQHKND